MLSQEQINMLVLMTQEHGDEKAVEKLWEYYFPLMEQLVLEYALKFEISDEEVIQDIVQDSFIFFKDAVLKFDFETYCFSFYLNRHMSGELSKLISKKYINDRMTEGFSDFTPEKRDYT